jgi:hypothetical protein
MKKIITTALVLASFAFAVVGTACSTETDMDESAVTQSAQIAADPGIWQLGRECGTQETGACSTEAAKCAPGAAIGGECPTGGVRCLTAPLQSGLQQLLLCNPTSSSTWTFNGDCTVNCADRPACKDEDNAGDRCKYPLKRCVKNNKRMLVCLTNGKTQYVFSGYCGENGGPACAGFADCPQDEDGIAGLACNAVGAACKRSTGGLTGKVFTCVTR